MKQLEHHDREGMRSMFQKYLKKACWFLLCFLFLLGCSHVPSNTEVGTTKDSAKGWPRTIENADGTTTLLEQKPKRIAVLHFGYTEYLLALGVTPIATTDLSMPRKFATLKPYQKELAQMEDLGSSMSPSIEKLIRLKPDLIIAGSFHQNILDQLKKIAPVVIDRRGYQDLGWKETILYYAKITGEEEKANQYIQETEKIIETTKKKLARYQNQTFVFLRPQSKGNFGIVGKKGFHYYHEQGFGLQTPANYPQEWQLVSLEGLAKLNPDVIFFQDDQKRSQQAVKQVEKDRVWQQINAVKNGRVYYLDVSLNTGSPLAIQLAAQTITENLEKSD